MAAIRTRAENNMLDSQRHRWKAGSFFDNNMIIDIVKSANIKMAIRAQGYDADLQYMVKETDELELALFGLLY
nr:unnamed protein product [Callosobruchus chinensis]